MRNYWLVYLILIAFPYIGKAQASIDARVYFEKGSSVIVPNYTNNAAISTFISRYERITEGKNNLPIHVISSVSPEGSDRINNALIIERANALITYIEKRLSFPDTVFVVLTKGVPVFDYSINVEDYPKFRYSEVSFLIPSNHLSISPSQVMYGRAEQNKGAELHCITSRERFIRVPLFALKTNLLFDAATVVNIGVEVPIGKRFSVAGEWIFPNWVDRNNNTFCIQANIKTVELKLWLGNREAKEKLTGHFLGGYYQNGDFDFQPFTTQGIRCFEGWTTGVSYGFSHSISKRNSLRMEYSLGLGYVSSRCCKYERISEGSILMTKEDWQYNASFFPVLTRASVSLVWMLYSRRKVK